MLITVMTLFLCARVSHGPRPRVHPSVAYRRFVLLKHCELWERRMHYLFLCKVQRVHVGALRIADKKFI